MATNVFLPRLGFSIEEGDLIEQIAAGGTVVAQVQPIYDGETERLVREIGSPADGALHISVATAGTYPLATRLAEIA